MDPEAGPFTVERPTSRVEMKLLPVHPAKRLATEDIIKKAAQIIEVPGALSPLPSSPEHIILIDPFVDDVVVLDEPVAQNPSSEAKFTDILPERTQSQAPAPPKEEQKPQSVTTKPKTPLQPKAAPKPGPGQASKGKSRPQTSKKTEHCSHTSHRATPKDDASICKKLDTLSSQLTTLISSVMELTKVQREQADSSGKYLQELARHARLQQNFHRGYTSREDMERMDFSRDWDRQERDRPRYRHAEDPSRNPRH